MTEVLVPAYRIRDQKRLDNFYGFLSTYPNLEWLSVDIELADIAARIRAQHSLRTPDAIQAATAIQFGATLLITNDPIFKRITEFHTLVLDDFV
jgi:predicted nucleic acid-binding protein